MLQQITSYARGYPQLMRSIRFWQRAAITFAAARPGRLAAALSYYTIFSIVPLLVLVLAITGLFLNDALVISFIQEKATEYLGAENGTTFNHALNALANQRGEALAVLIGVAGLIFASLGAFSEMQDGLNVIWGAQDERVGVKGFLMQRALSFGMIVTIGFLLLITFVVSALVSLFGNILATSSLSLFVVAFLNQVVSAVFVTALFILIFKTLPAAHVSIKSALVGGVVSALLFLAGKSLFTFYVGTSTTLSVYGNAGALFALLLFVYYAGLILYFGASVARTVGEVRR